MYKHGSVKIIVSYEYANKPMDSVGVANLTR